MGIWGRASRSRTVFCYLTSSFNSNFVHTGSNYITLCSKWANLSKNVDGEEVTILTAAYTVYQGCYRPTELGGIFTYTCIPRYYRSSERKFPVGTFAPRSENTGERKVPELTIRVVHNCTVYVGLLSLRYRSATYNTNSYNKLSYSSKIRNAVVPFQKLYDSYKSRNATRSIP